jgi:hypothetical protein
MVNIRDARNGGSLSTAALSNLNIFEHRVRNRTGWRDIQYMEIVMKLCTKSLTWGLT